MREDTNDNRPKKKNNNFYWIYGAIALVFILLQIFSMQGNLKDTNWSELKEMIKNEDVKKIIVVNEEYAEITIREDRIKENSKYKELRDNGFMEGSGGPHYKYEFVTVDNFMTDLKELQEDSDLSYWPHVTGEKRRNWGSEILGWLIPILFLVALWIFLMRMMSRGGGGGGKPTLEESDAADASGSNRPNEPAAERQTPSPGGPADVSAPAAAESSGTADGETDKTGGPETASSESAVDESDRRTPTYENAPIRTTAEDLSGLGALHSLLALTVAVLAATLKRRRR